MAVKIVNIEQGMPRVEEAIKQLRMEISTQKRLGVRAVKVIHGYGSTGSGGAIRQAAQQFFRQQQRQGRIKAFCPGESFGPFESSGRDMLALEPQLHKDRDWGRHNDGVTVVILR